MIIPDSLRHGIITMVTVVAQGYDAICAAREANIKQAPMLRTHESDEQLLQPKYYWNPSVRRTETLRTFYASTIADAIRQILAEHWSHPEQ